MKYATFKRSPFDCSQVISEEELRRNHREAAEAGMSPLVETFATVETARNVPKQQRLAGWLAFRELSEKGA